MTGVQTCALPIWLLDELGLMAGWLGLDEGVEIVGAGDLAPALAAVA